jgi:hypothetical protein
MEWFQKNIPKKQKKGFMKLRNLIYFILFFLFIGSLLWGWLWMQGEAEGTVRTGTVKEELPKEEEKPVTYTGKYFSIELPAGYQEKSHSTPETLPVLETLYVVRSGSMSEKIAITLERRAEKEFDSSPGYQLRERDVSYSKKIVKDGEQEIVVLSKKSDPFEKTLYFFEDDVLVSVSYTSSVAKEEGENELLSIKKTLKILTEEERKIQAKKAEEGLQ